MDGIAHFGCAALFLAGFLVFGWISVTDHNAEWAGLLALGCLLLAGFNLLAMRDLSADHDNRADS